MTTGTRGGYLDRPLRDVLAELGSADPVPAAGSAAALSAALAAALTAKVARRSARHRDDAAALAARADRLSHRLARLASVDAVTFARVLEAPSDDADLAEALRAAAEPPSMIAEAGQEVAAIAADLVASGNPNLRHDAQAAVDLARTATRSASALAAADLDAAGA